MKAIFNQRFRKLIVFVFMLIPVISQAGSSEGIRKTDFLEIIIIGLLFFIVGILIYALYVLNLFVNKTRKDMGSISVISGILTNLSDAVPLENEAEIMLDHDYDGIRELDNNLPLWWKYMFYGTIVFSGIYLYYYHSEGNGKLQIEEYETELVVAQKEVDEYMKQAANSIDEHNVKLLTDSKGVESGKALFTQNCSACHGKDGEGGVGPNLTDKYWLHGGGVKNVFKTIKYGVPENGMKSWKGDFSPKNIQEIASFIVSLQGSNPANGKAPQGDVYEEKK